MMCHLAHCRGEETVCLQFQGGRAQLCFSNAWVPVGKMFDSQSAQVAQTPCEQFPLNKKKMNMDFSVDLLIRAFFGRGDWEACQSELCLLVVGSYSKTQVSSQVITRCRKSDSLVTRSKSFQETNTRLSFCSSDKFFGTSFAQIFLMCRSSVMIQWTSIFGSPTSSAINHTLKCQFLSRTTFTRATSFAVLAVEGLPARSLS